MCRAHALAAVLAAVAGLWIGVPSAGAQDAVPGIPVHDPVMIEEEGTYYLFATGHGIAAWTSPDMAQWTRAEPVFDTAPAWTDRVVPGFDNHIWAPDVAYHGGTYYLYYSISSFARNRSAIGVATTPTLDPDDPAHAWTDHGPIVESVPGRDLWNAIDANLVFDGAGTPWLAFGSFWRGLKLVKLRASLTDIARSPQAWHTIAARKRTWTLDETAPGDGAIEAPFIFEKHGYYYLFVSWNYCCRGEASTYEIRVGRSKDVTGPYVDREGQAMHHGGGTLVLDGNSRWAGVGHNAAYTFDGTDYLVFHGYDRAEDGDARLWIEAMTWDDDGWPVVALDE